MRDPEVLRTAACDTFAIYLSLYLSISIYIYLPIYLYPSIYLSIYLYLSVSIYQSACALRRARVRTVSVRERELHAHQVVVNPEPAMLHTHQVAGLHPTPYTLNVTHYSLNTGHAMLHTDQVVVSPTGRATNTRLCYFDRTQVTLQRNE